MNRKAALGLNFDSPPAQSRKRRLFWRVSRYRRQTSPVSEVLLQFTHGQITSFSQDFLVLLSQLFPKEFHCSGTCCVGNNSSPFAACPDAEFVSPMAGWTALAPLPIEAVPPFTVFRRVGNTTSRAASTTRQDDSLRESSCLSRNDNNLESTKSAGLKTCPDTNLASLRVLCERVGGFERCHCRERVRSRNTHPSQNWRRMGAPARYGAEDFT